MDWRPHKQGERILADGTRGDNTKSNGLKRHESFKREDDRGKEGMSLRALSVRSFVWLGILINIQGVNYAGALTSFDTALFGSQREGDKLLRHDPNSYWTEKQVLPLFYNYIGERFRSLGLAAKWGEFHHNGSQEGTIDEQPEL